MDELLPINESELLLDRQSALLIEHIRQTLTIHAEMFRRILDSTSRPSLVLAELLEDAGNRYIDFGTRIRGVPERSYKLKSVAYPSR